MNDIILPFGKYKGKAIQDTPYGYQYWLRRNCESFLRKQYPEILRYLKETEELEEWYNASIPAWYDLMEFDC